jgi:F-type H+-transporting ATPase subunit b
MRLATLSRLCALAALVVLVSAVPALAADTHGGEAGGEHGGGILDKMSFTGIQRWDLGIYTLIVFGILLFVLSKFAWPNIKAGLEKREANIFTALEQARKDRAEAEARLAEARKQLAEAAQQAGGILAEARKDAEALKAAETEKGAKDAQAERERAKREIDSKMEAMKKELMQEVAQLAALMASKALGRQVTLETQRELIDESIAELKANANKA